MSIAVQNLTYPTECEILDFEPDVRTGTANPGAKKPRSSEGRGSSTHARKPIEKASAPQPPPYGLRRLDCVSWTGPPAQRTPRPSRYNWRMDNATSDASSSVGFLVDIFRLIPPSARSAFADMSAHELRGRDLRDDEMRRVAVNVWHQFCKYGWRRI
jgi:hypothetical protein